GHEARPSLEAAPDLSGALPYVSVHRDSNVEIYRNRDVYPRAFVVYDLINTDDFNKALDLLSDADINLGQTAIIEAFPDDLESAIKKNRQGLSAVPASVE